MKRLTEKNLIAMVKDLQTPLPKGFVGIGDDAAVLPEKNAPWVISQDMLVEGTHFRWDWAEPQFVGYKAAAVNLSDMAAMGAIPEAALTSLAIPPNTSMEVMADLYQALSTMLGSFGVPIVGGDTVGTHGPLVIDVTILGVPTAFGPVLRQGAQVGDRLMMTGTVGASRGGLALLQAGIHWPGRDADEKALLTAHLRPVPRVVVGQQVAEHVHAMTDISDGFALEVGELALGADIWMDKLPVWDATRRVAGRLGQAVESWAVFGGEDYELLMAVPPERVEAMRALGQGVGLVEVGIVTGRSEIRWIKEGRPVHIDGQEVAFDHFLRD